MMPHGQEASADFARHTNEELVRLLQARRCEPAATELVRRLHDLVAAYAIALARSARLQAADIDDAKQDAILVLWRALPRFDGERGQSKGCRFHTFLLKLVSDQFKDERKRWRRAEAHYDRTVSVDEGDDVWPPGRTAPAGPAGDDPALAAEWEELLLAVERSVRELSPRQRCICAAVAAGRRLTAVAALLEIGYGAVKYQWQEICAQLRGRLGGAPGPFAIRERAATWLPGSRAVAEGESP